MTRMRLSALLAVAAAVAALPAAAAGAARPDPSFGAGKGYVTTAVRGHSAVAYAAAAVRGRIVVAGQAITPSGNGQVLVARYRSSGALDRTFADGGIFRSSLPASRGPFIGTSLAVEPGTGRLLVGGGYGQGSMLALRLTAGGRLDRTFGAGRGYTAVAAGGTAQTIALDRAGRVLLGGSNANANGRPMVVARLTRSGALDRAFGRAGQAQSLFWNPDLASSAGVAGLAVTAGGGVVAMGHLDYIGGDGHGSAGVFALSSAGRPQTGFGTAGHAEIAFPTATGFQQWFPCALLRDAWGRITVPGNGSNGSAGAVLSIRLTAAGALDPSFGTGGRASVPGPSAASDTTCGAVAAPGGGLTVGVGSTLARITGVGAADPAFGPGGRVRITSPSAVGLNAAAAGTARSVVAAGSAGRRLYVGRWLTTTALRSASATVAAATSVSPRPTPKILSASWGTDNGVGCPSGAKNLDNIPVTFNWFVRRSTIQTTDFQIVRDDGTTATPTCALQYPPDEADEAQTVNLIGDFGDSVHGPTPVAIRIVGALQGKAPGANRWKPFPPLKQAQVEPLPGGPYVVDAWTLTPALYRRDRNRCTTGRTFVRVMWSNGLTAYPTGEEVGAPVVSSYRAVYRRTNGRTVAIAPLDVADLHDHQSAFNADNMHDLCLPRPPKGARLTGVTIAADLIQDPDGDPNLAQRFRVPRVG